MSRTHIYVTNLRRHHTAVESFRDSITHFCMHTLLYAHTCGLITDSHIYITNSYICHELIHMSLFDISLSREGDGNTCGLITDSHKYIMNSYICHELINMSLFDHTAVESLHDSITPSCVHHGLTYTPHELMYMSRTQYVSRTNIDITNSQICRFSWCMYLTLMCMSQPQIYVTNSCIRLELMSRTHVTNSQIPYGWQQSLFLFFCEYILVTNSCVCHKLMSRTHLCVTNSCHELIHAHRYHTDGSRVSSSSFARYVLQCVAVCCSILQFVAAFCSVLQRGAVCCNVVQCVATCCSVLQCCSVFYGWEIVCCSVLQCVAVCCSVLQYAGVCHELV